MKSANDLVATLIYNPLAGMLDVEPALRSVVDFWQNRGWRIDIKATNHVGHARNLAEQAVNSGHRMILVAGGDGTLGEVVGGMMNSDCILAPLPSGTGNSFAKELALPLRNLLGKRDLVRACEALSTGKVRMLDVGESNGITRWFQWTGIGADGHVVSHIEPRNRRMRRLGSIGYLALGIPTLRSYKGMNATIAVDNKIFPGRFSMVIISNCQRYAGGQVILNPGAVLDDGYFEVSMFEGDGNRDVMRYIFELSRGRHGRDKRIKVVKGKHIEVVTEMPSPIHHDGDPGGFTPLTCRVLPRAVRLLVPESAPSSLFQGVAQDFIG